MPDFSFEIAHFETGKEIIAGVDEAGRGPLAGPVVAAAVVLDAQNTPSGLNDSKQLSSKRRNALFVEILNSSYVSWASVSAQQVDAMNIRQATLLAMRISVRNLSTVADVALIDGRDIPDDLVCEGQAIVGGDGKSLSIAAASIVAKTVRDGMMIRLHEMFPHYGFDQHKGYGSKAHRDAIAEYGACPIHRMSFAPMRLMQ
ncbi:MAG: ribonuclease HII [Pseudomonadota bacterium]